MPLYHPRNLYRGVNAHFQSYCQAESDWESFHGAFVTLLAMAVSKVLPPAYAVRPEQGLQIREYHPDTGQLILGRPKPDASIFDALSRPMAITPFAFDPSPQLVMELEESLPQDPESYLRAIHIYEVDTSKARRLGKPVCHIEILSPTNKPPNSGYWAYIAKREQLLRGGVNLVEVDFLHESPSPLQNLPIYPDQVPYASPYYIAISVPAPSLKEGEMAVYNLGIDEAIPVIHVPLRPPDFIPVDFGGVYTQTYEALYSKMVDYAEVPEHFDRYHPADQAKIRALMQRVSEQEA
jgi:hypothetical protein